MSNGPKIVHPKQLQTNQGEMSVSIFTKDDKVIVDFGGPTAWIGMSAPQAIALADAITNRAKQLLGQAS